MDKTSLYHTLSLSEAISTFPVKSMTTSDDVQTNHVTK